MKHTKMLSHAVDTNGDVIFYVMQVGNHLIRYFQGNVEIKDIPLVNGIPTL